MSATDPHTLMAKSGSFVSSLFDETSPYIGQFGMLRQRWRVWKLPSSLVRRYLPSFDRFSITLKAWTTNFAQWKWAMDTFRGTLYPLSALDTLERKRKVIFRTKYPSSLSIWLGRVRSPGAIIRNAIGAVSSKRKFEVSGDLRDRSIPWKLVCPLGSIVRRFPVHWTTPVTFRSLYILFVTLLTFF